MNAIRDCGISTAEAGERAREWSKLLREAFRPVTLGLQVDDQEETK